MAITLVASTGKGFGTATSGSTDPIDTTGATLLVASISWWTGATNPTISDNKGNTWVQLPDYASSIQSGNRLVYALTPIVGSGHVFSFTGNSAAAIVFYAFAGPTTFHSATGNFSGGVAALQTGAVTPSSVPALVIAGLGSGGSPTISIDLGFTAITLAGASGSNVAAGGAYLIQTTAATVNPTWTLSVSNNCGASIATFLEAGTPAPTDVRLTNLYTEVLTQNATADVRVTNAYVETLIAPVPAADVRVTSEIVEVLIAPPLPVVPHGAGTRSTQQVVEVWTPPPPIPQHPVDRAASESIGLTWMEFNLEEPDGTSFVHVWAKVDQPDPPSYYYGFKEARILQWGDIKRGLSDDQGDYESASFSCLISDYDQKLRKLLAHPTKRFGFINRQVAWRMISDAERRALLTPRLIARGITQDYEPQSPFHFSMTMEDFVTSKFSSQNEKKQIPQRLLSRFDFPTLAKETAGLPVPIIYGHVTDAGETEGPGPIVTGETPYGAFSDVGQWWAGFGPNVQGSTAAIPTGVTLALIAGGTMPADVPDGKYGVVVTAVDSSGRESDPSSYYWNGGFGGTRGTFMPIVPTIVVNGTQSIRVTWTASAGAAKYRVYLGFAFYGIKWTQFIETTATTVTFNTGPTWFEYTHGQAGTLSTGASGINYAVPYLRYAVQAVFAGGTTSGRSAEVIANATPYRRSERIEWFPVTDALEYRVLRRSDNPSPAGPQPQFDRQWTVPITQVDAAGHLYFHDDMVDTGVTYLDQAQRVPTGALPTIYVGQMQDIYGTVWETFLLAGHAIKGIDDVYFDGVRVDPGNFGVTWAVPGKTNFALYFPNTGNPQYRDINGHRYTLLYVRGPDGAEAAGGKKITVNASGIETVGDGTGTLITDIVLQYHHFLVNFGFQNWQTGSWLPTPDWSPLDPGLLQIDEASFIAVRDVMLGILPGGYKGGGIIGSDGQLTLREWIARWNISAGVQSFFSRNQQFAVAMFNEHTDLSTTIAVTQLHDIHKDSFSTKPERDSWFTEIHYSYAYQWAEKFWQKEDQYLTDAVAEAAYKQKQIAPTRELWFVRDSATANSLMARYLLRRRQPPVIVSLVVDARFLHIELGTIIRVTHLEGIGTTSEGWVERAVYVTRHEMNPDNFAVRIEAEDVDELMATVEIVQAGFQYHAP